MPILSLSVTRSRERFKTGCVSIEELSAKFRNHQVTSTDLTRTALDLANGPHGTAVFTYRCDARALGEAAAADRLRDAGSFLSPLAGLPVTIKDVFDLCGETTSAGSRVLSDATPATEDAEVVWRLRAAGAVLLGRTNMTEFAYSGASAAPFHMWTPDVYEGAPTPITAFMATATKVAAFAAFLRIFVGTLPDGRDDWRVIIAIVAAASILIGNIAALRQQNVKRILAYSGVAQAGYLLIGVAAGSVVGTRATLYYLIAYVAMTLGVFAIVIHREREVENGDDIEAFRGYGRDRPAMGIAATICLLSLAGFPPLSGFVGKFLLFGAAVDHDLTWLAVVGAIGSVISLGYYLRLVAVMWMDDPKRTESRRLPVPGAVGLVAVSCAVVVVGLALAAAGVLDASSGAAETLISP